jgi:tetratricopeptide (TPR) repeat protein
MLKESAAQQRRKLPRSSHTHTGEVSVLLRSAEADLNGGKPAQAIDVLRKAVPLDDGDPDAHNLLGSALARTGDLPSAVVELKRAVEIGPSLASAHYSLGVALWFSNQRRDALNELERSIALDPSQYSACSFLGMVLRQTGDAARARQMLQRAIALNGDAPQPYFDLANLYLTQNNLPAALAQLDSGLNLNPQPGAVTDLDLTVTQLRTALAPNASNAEARNTLGRLLGLAGAGEQQIVAEFEEAIRTDPNYAEAYNNLGLVYTQSGTDDKAEKAFRSAIGASPEFADAHQNLGALLIISDAPGAIRELEKAVALQPQMLKAHYNLAQAYDASGSDNLEKEIEELQKLVAIAPKYPKAEFALGKALLKKGDLQGAVTHLQAAVGADAKSGEAQYQLGLALSRAGRKVEGTAAMAKSRELNADNQRQQAANLDLREGRTLLEANGKTDEALSRFNRVVADNPDSPEGHYYLGMALLQKAENAQAATEFRRALTLSPTYEEAKAELAKLESPASDQRRPAIEGAIREGKFEDAERSLEQYLGDQPKSAWAWYALGYAYYGEHKIGESIKALAQSLQLDIKNPEAHKVLGRDMMLIGRFDAARIEFQQGIRYDPKSAELHYNLGKLYSIQDNWAQAKTCFERAIALNSSFMEAYDGLGLALESLGDKNEATVKYQKAIDLAEQQHARFSAAHVNMSALYNTSGDPKKALAFAQRALEVNPQSDRALFQMAKAYELDGRTDAVIDSLHRAIAINPNSSSYFYLLSTAYRKAGNAEESRVALESFKKLNNLNRELEQKRLDWVKEEGSRAPTKSPAGAGSF